MASSQRPMWLLDIERRYEKLSNDSLDSTPLHIKITVLDPSTQPSRLFAKAIRITYSNHQTDLLTLELEDIWDFEGDDLLIVPPTDSPSRTKVVELLHLELTSGLTYAEIVGVTHAATQLLQYIAVLTIIKQEEMHRQPSLLQEVWKYWYDMNSENFTKYHGVHYWFCNAATRRRDEVLPTDPSSLQHYQTQWLNAMKKSYRNLLDDAHPYFLSQFSFDTDRLTVEITVQEQSPIGRTLPLRHTITLHDDTSTLISLELESIGQLENAQNLIDFLATVGGHVWPIGTVLQLTRLKLAPNLMDQEIAALTIAAVRILMNTAELILIEEAEMLRQPSLLQETWKAEYFMLPEKFIEYQGTRYWRCDNPIG